MKLAERLYWRRITSKALDIKATRRRWRSIGFPDPLSWAEWFRVARA